MKQGKSRDAALHLNKAAMLQPNRECIRDDLEAVHDGHSGTR